MKKQDVFRSLAVLMVAGALITGCADNQMMDKMKSAVTGMKDKIMGKKKMTGDDPAVTARRKLMRGIGADMKRLKAAMKQGSGWVVEEQLRQAAGDMYKKASKIKKAFKKNTLARPPPSGRTRRNSTSLRTVWPPSGRTRRNSTSLRTVWPRTPPSWRKSTTRAARRPSRRPWASSASNAEHATSRSGRRRKRNNDLLEYRETPARFAGVFFFGQTRPGRGC